MPTLTIRNLDTETHDFLRRQAAEHGRSMEAEVRDLLDAHRNRAARAPGDVAQSIRARFANAGVLDVPEREALPEPPAL